jgi:hypothetical protein
VVEFNVVLLLAARMFAVWPLWPRRVATVFVGFLSDGVIVVSKLMVKSMREDEQAFRLQVYVSELVLKKLRAKLMLTC